ncbi:HemK methyltransferase family member 1 [Galdieria sulphuraria]|uniref:peptide chain release factor N(5)-glutamine methyltransferase n=1 Tax=Galdieria sulphuraria TaxID=130081 RepID=M2XEP0_GALSU|nr:methyltransferase [Galdieria sulphuraria]EME28442.1 methyltransferase [Galdieria sulphuraria]GJD12214.1 HemK methyltransferase family member 1 [Galdieria sulphuraria]|eukprot:XP_005704962.1 methyltransferase [Galdieria sulphuraria]
MFVSIACNVLNKSWLLIGTRRGCVQVFLPNRYHKTVNKPSNYVSCSSQLSETELRDKLRVCSTTKELVTRLSEVFVQQGVPESRLSAEYIVATSFGLSRKQLLRGEPTLLSQLEPFYSTLTHNALRRLLREPVQYIVGNWDFYNLTLKVRQPVLIPRPETEELVDRILKFWKNVLRRGSTGEVTRCLEIGCGSGAISLSLLKGWKEFTGNNNILKVTALDIDPQAITLTKENACIVLEDEQKRLLDIHLQDITKFRLDDNKYDFLVSNPPYIPEAEYRTLQPEVIQYEASCALLGGKDGMEIIRVILRGAKNWLKTGGTIWLEVDPSHPKLIQDFLHKEPNVGVELLQVFEDMSGLARYCKLLVI